MSDNVTLLKDNEKRWHTHEQHPGKLITEGCWVSRASAEKFGERLGIDYEVVDGAALGWISTRKPYHHVMVREEQLQVPGLTITEMNPKDVRDHSGRAPFSQRITFGARSEPDQGQGL